MNVIETKGLRHAYGTTQVLRGVDLAVPAGSIYGFLGRNGAGKSTCIRILSGLLGGDEGEVRVLGRDPSRWGRETLARLGYLGESSFLPGQMPVGRLIAWTRTLYPSWSDVVVTRLLSRFHLPDRKRVYQLSLGQQRQLGFLLAVAPRPEVLILDEPAANLDTVARRTFLEEIAGLAREEGTTVFFSTHVLGDVERVADRVGVLTSGALLVDEPLDVLKETIRQVRFYWSQPEAPPIRPPGAYRVREARGETLVTMRLADDAEAAALARSIGCNCEVRGLNLEDLFVELTQEEIQ